MLDALMLALFCVATPGAARAEAALGLGVDVGRGAIGRDTQEGGGLAMYLGVQSDVMRFTLGLEGVVSHHEFTGPAPAGVTRGILGARLRLGSVLEPGFFGHMGLAHLSGEGAFTAPAFDVGVSLDLTAVSTIDVGAHAAYNVMFGDDTRRGYTFFTVGLHAILVL